MFGSRRCTSAGCRGLLANRPQWDTVLLTFLVGVLSLVLWVGWRRKLRRSSQSIVQAG